MMSAKGGIRKKPSDFQTKRALYEKHIPYISDAIGSIIDKSRNPEFRSSCKQLLQVEDSTKIRDKLSSKLFALTVGDKYSSKIVPHNQEDNSPSSSVVDTSFSDLADHVENDGKQCRWSFVQRSASLGNVTVESHRNTTALPLKMKASRQTDCHTLQSKERPAHMASVVQWTDRETEKDVGARITSESSDFAYCESDFELLRNDVFAKLPLNNMIVESNDRDQNVPEWGQSWSNEAELIRPVYQSKKEGRTRKRIEEDVFEDEDDDDHFETLGKFVHY